MKTIKLYFDFEFTSLSPDAQPISLGIVSDDKIHSPSTYPVGVIGWDRLSAMELAKVNNLRPNNKESVILYRPEHFCSWIFSNIIIPKQVGSIEGYELSEDMQKALDFALKHQVVKEEVIQPKSFYAEFTDFDINRCDDWVKKNVISKLRTDTNGIQERHLESTGILEGDYYARGNFKHMQWAVKQFLHQFYEYDIQFICDCGTFDWYWMLQLLAEWEEKSYEYNLSASEIIKAQNEGKLVRFPDLSDYRKMKFGLPQLPTNISPVPQDLNDLIALKKGISMSEAFELNREDLNSFDLGMEKFGVIWHVKHHPFIDGESKKHNALHDAKVIKEIYKKLS